MNYNLYKKRKRIPWHLASITNSFNLPMTVWISFKNGKGKYGPWIQVSTVSTSFSNNLKEQ